MKTLDDEMLFVIHLMKKQTNSQKLRVLNSLSEQLNYIVADNQILFLTKTLASEEIACNFKLELDNIYSIFCTGSFLLILTHHCILNVLDLESHTLYFWHPTTDSAFTGLMTWECKARMTSVWLKLLYKIKNLVPRINTGNETLRPV